MSEFFYMGGYASYVWSSYTLALIVLLPTILLPILENKRLIKKLKGKYKRQQADFPGKNELHTKHQQQQYKQNEKSKKDTEK